MTNTLWQTPLSCLPFISIKRCCRSCAWLGQGGNSVSGCPGEHRCGASYTGLCQKDAARLVLRRVRVVSSPQCILFLWLSTLLKHWNLWKCDKKCYWVAHPLKIKDADALDNFWLPSQMDVPVGQDPRLQNTFSNTDKPKLLSDATYGHREGGRAKEEGVCVCAGGEGGCHWNLEKTVGFFKESGFQL